MAAGQNVGFIGLGSMGGPMAINLVQAGFAVTGFDVSAAAMETLRAAGGATAGSPAMAAEGANLLCLVVATADQADSALFGDNGALETLPAGATVALHSTVPPSYAEDLGARLAERGHPLLDAPISGGQVGAKGATLTVMASGTAEAFGASEAALDAMSQKIYRLGDKPGIGSVVKMVNQLLAGVHIAAAAEAMALGTRVGADPNTLFEVISASAGASWMFGNRVPRMIAGDRAPTSAVEIFVKDLGIVLDTGKAARFPLPISAAAHQQFLAAAAAGWGRDDDSSVVRVYETLANIDVAKAAAKK